MKRHSISDRQEEIGINYEEKINSSYQICKEV